ncbi:hypothetical protein ACGRHY_29990 [Streptomyces sp. HK10]|uniref:hypothetical protein n=1 Tax=Streptomyces sp. HK10 TaxID=3373255 RepID=UPI0037495AF6
MARPFTAEDARIWWKFGEGGEEEEFPGAAAVWARGLRTVNRCLTTDLTDLFASLIPGAALSVLLFLVRREAGPAPVPVWAAARPVRRMRPQAGHGAVAPVRGSPGAGATPLALPGARPPT